MPAVSVVSPGNATLHARARCGTNHTVLGVAEKIWTPGRRVPRAMESRVVQGKMVVVPDGCSVRRKSDVAGIVTQAVAVVIVPRSIFHIPPGVCSSLPGKARIRTAAHGPSVHVVFVTSTGTLRGASIGDE